MEVPAPAWSARCLLNTAFAVMLLAFPSTGLSSECTLNIHVPKNSKINQREDQSVALRCPVFLCSQDLPKVTWCKTESDGQCKTVMLDHRISSKWENSTENFAVHILKIDNSQINDTGFYGCSITSGQLQIVGSLIEVTFALDETTTMNMPSTNSTSLPTFPSLEQFKILVYLMASAGGLCVLIIIVSLIVFCHRRRQGKCGSSADPKTTEEVQFFSTSKSPENCLEHAEVSPQPGKEITMVSTETTYDNAHLGNSPSLILPPEEDDSIVYADLNHNAKKMQVQFEAENEVEYATVRMT